MKTLMEGAIMFHANNGYVGYSMSVRAQEAYADGLMPLTKWTKTAIVEAVEALDGWWVTNCDLRTFTASALKQYFLRCQEWHHTGNLFNETSFYGIVEKKVASHDVGALAALDKDLRAQKSEATAVDVVLTKGHIIYDEWEGSRRHGRFVERAAACIIIGDWAFTVDGKKRLDGAHIKSVQRFVWAPRGTAETYNRIKRGLPLKYQKM